MLRHSQTHFIKPAAFHLGDLVNIIQLYHLQSLTDQDLYCMFTDVICPCCGVNAADMMQFILGLLDTRVKFKNLSEEATLATPMWFKKHAKHLSDYKVYDLAKSLPTKKKHAICQFDGRSRGNKRPANEEIEKILKRFPNIINIGDKELSCKNRTGLKLQDKFKLIASARFYIGIDSGLTHLALMTKTPVYVIHPKEWRVRRYYPKSKQIKFSTSAEELIGKINPPSRS